MDAQIVGDRYALEGRLGEGGMGLVYRARHVQLGKAFALKLMSPEFCDDAAARARFTAEAKLASGISHPNVVSIVDYGEDARFGAFMVMELLDGEPLLATRPGPMMLKRAFDVLSQVADALDHIHRHGIVHGDVKAENIIVTSEKSGPRRRTVVQLIDFGLASSGGARDELGCCGTPHYMAPELVGGGAPSVASDVYALGVLAYLLLTGSLPFNGDASSVMASHAHDLPPSMSERRGELLDDAVEKLVARALAKDPGRRHPSAAAFRYELNAVMGMLDLRRGRNRASSSESGARLARLFDQSPLAQALIATTGDIVLENPAFARLIRRSKRSQASWSLADTRLYGWIADLMHAVREVHINGVPTHRRCVISRDGDRRPLEIVVVLSPSSVAGSEVHVVVHVEALAETLS